MRHLNASDLFEEPDGELVHDWNLMYAAKWLGVPVWVLMEQPAYYAELAKLGMEAEAEEAKKARKRAGF